MTSAIQSTYSVKVNTAIGEYNKHIKFLSTTYQSIEGAKGRWHIRWDEFKAGRFPATEEELKTTMNDELDAYEKLVKATEQSKILLSLFRSTIEYLTRPRISAQDYETLARRGYKTTPSLEGEAVLPEICGHLETLHSRINVIQLHMNDRLPKAAVNLNGVCQEIFKQKKMDTWADAAMNLVKNNYLQKALEEKNGEEKSLKEDSRLATTSSVAVSDTTPESELAALGEILQTLKTLSAKDPIRDIPTLDTAQPVAVSTPKLADDLEDKKISTRLQQDPTPHEAIIATANTTTKLSSWNKESQDGKKRVGNAGNKTPV